MGLPQYVNIGIAQIPDMPPDWDLWKDGRDWSKGPVVGFEWHEVQCQHSGMYPINTPAVLRHYRFMEYLRYVYSGPIGIVSWLRYFTHPIEANKEVPGSHATGCACDIRITSGTQLIKLERAIFLAAEELGIEYIGKGSANAAGDRRLHVDTFGPRPNAPRPNSWTY